MRVSLVLFIVIIMVRMIYDLTFNPVEAIVNIIYKNGSDPANISKQIAKVIVPCILLAIVWTAIMPDIIAYYGQPFEEETHVLSQMPMYGNRYLELKEDGFGVSSRRYRYMKTGDTDFSETDRGSTTNIVKSDTGTNTVSIVYQNPRLKAPYYFFMDALTWPNQRKNVEYTFSIVYN